MVHITPPVSPVVAPVVLPSVPPVVLPAGNQFRSICLMNMVGPTDAVDDVLREETEEECGRFGMRMHAQRKHSIPMWAYLHSPCTCMHYRCGLMLVLMHAH